MKKLEKHSESADLRLVNVQQYVHVYFTRACTVTAAVACAETVDCMYVYVKPVSTAHFVCIGQNVTKI